MRKVTLEDVAAISHAETYFFGAIKSDTEARLRREIEDDLDRLAFVKQQLLRTIYEPGLPINSYLPEEPKPDGDTS